MEANPKARKPRMGALAPRYLFVLNPHSQARFTKCPQCETKTRVRKIPLVIHVPAVGLVTLGKRCRLCLNCEILIAHQADVDGLIGALRQRQGAKGPPEEYLVLGTTDFSTWRRGFSGRISLEELAPHMADFKGHLKVDYAAGGWVSPEEPAG
jgi:hypothetical protein